MTAVSAATRDVLTRGALTVKGRMPWSSNATFLVEATLDGARALAIYKPERGERPLWDFPAGLWRRELAAYHLSEALGWGIVPLTLAREGPYGEGSLQQFVQADFEQHYLTLRADPRHRDRLVHICAFDVVANNADRKSGHCLLDAAGVIWAIDNGLCFNAEPKLRTVIWDFAGEPVPEPLLADLRRLLDGVPEAVAALLAPAEQEALLARAKALVRRGRFPREGADRSYPWPLV
ncbi:MAG TPA: SCO1664 family protein [Candidatus Tectomicrobia bacterium]|nr:SCO1664 family protein [Candidatus Tectomicrobia bacterium]